MEPLTKSEIEMLIKMLGALSVQGKVEDIRKSLEAIDLIETKLKHMLTTAPVGVTPE
jgi:hypothetical protein